MHDQLRRSLWVSHEWIINTFTWKLAIDEVLRINIANVVIIEHCVDVVTFMDGENVPVAVD